MGEGPTKGLSHCMGPTLGAGETQGTVGRCRAQSQLGSTRLKKPEAAQDWTAPSSRDQGSAETFKAEKAEF